MAEHATDFLFFLLAAAPSFLHIHTPPRGRPIAVRAIAKPRS